MSNDHSTHQQIAKTIVQSASEHEQEALKIWAQGLLDIRATNLPTLAKAQQAIKHTIDSKVILPIIKRSSVELKRVGWDG